MRLPTDPKGRFAAVASLLLASCCATTPTAGPPWALLEDCPEPPAQIATNGDLVRHARQLRNALRGCNDDKRALREWAERTQ
jgi:hypothetical protein